MPIPGESGSFLLSSDKLELIFIEVLAFCKTVMLEPWAMDVSLRVMPLGIPVVESLG